MHHSLNPFNLTLFTVMLNVAWFNPPFIPPYFPLFLLSFGCAADVCLQLPVFVKCWLLNIPGFLFISVINIVAGLRLETGGNLPKQMVTLLGGAEPGTRAAGLRCSSTENQGFPWHLCCASTWQRTNERISVFLPGNSSAGVVSSSNHLVSLSVHSVVFYQNCSLNLK